MDTIVNRIDIDFYRQKCTFAKPLVTMITSLTTLTFNFHQIEMEHSLLHSWKKVKYITDIHFYDPYIRMSLISVKQKSSMFQIATATLLGGILLDIL